MDEELNDWATELESISNQISNIASDLRQDKYGANRNGILAALKKYKTKLEYVIEQIPKK